MSEFYVGYLPSAPPGIRRRVRLLVATVLLLSAAGAVLFAASQRNFSESFFEYGKPAGFSGTVALHPFPTLLPDSPATPGKAFEPAYLLVAPGKHGADAVLAGRDGSHVHLRGTLIHREEGQMIEIDPASVTAASGSDMNSRETRDLGETTLRGEIVDTKCYLGVMNPGEGKVHRDCAARCLSGGIPPALATRDIDGSGRIVLLTGEAGKPLPKTAFLALVGQPVAIQGRVTVSQGLYFLQTSAPGITALP
ncbi:MAG TPA: hypothetical protein VJX70_13515 [Candidatus Acidoferrum sp.]|nr:hypothetical protein [Candidatus Acidoferrum sp.]